MIYVTEELAHVLIHKFRKSEQIKSESRNDKSDIPRGEYTHEEMPTNVLANPEDVSFQLALRGFFIMLAISMHAVFEGIAMGLGSKASFVWYLCFAVAVHKFIIAFCIGLQVRNFKLK